MALRGCGNYMFVLFVAIWLLHLHKKWQLLTTACETPTNVFTYDGVFVFVLSVFAWVGVMMPLRKVV